MNKKVLIWIGALVIVWLIGLVIFLLDKAQIINKPKVSSVESNVLNIQPDSINTATWTKLSDLSILYNIYNILPKSGETVKLWEPTNKINIPAEAYASYTGANTEWSGWNYINSWSVVAVENKPMNINEALAQIEDMLSKNNTKEEMDKFKALFNFNDLKNLITPVLVVSNDWTRACLYKPDTLNNSQIDKWVIFLSKELKITTLWLNYDTEKVISIHKSCMLMQTAIKNDDNTYLQNVYFVDANKESALKVGSVNAMDNNPLYVQVINEESPIAIVMQWSGVWTGASLNIFNTTQWKNIMKEVSPIYNIVYKTNSNVLYYPSSDNTLHSYNITTGEDKTTWDAIPVFDVKTFMWKYYFIMNWNNVNIYDSSNKEILHKKI